MRHPLGFAAIALMAFVSAICGGMRDAIESTGSSSVDAKTPALSSLVGATWRLVSVDGREALAGVRVTAVFDEQNRVSGSGGCNRYSGRAAVEDQQLEVGALATTRMHCGEEGVMAQEHAYLSALAKATVFHVAGTDLQLGPAPGAVTLVFATGG